MMEEDGLFPNEENASLLAGFLATHHEEEAAIQIHEDR